MTTSDDDWRRQLPAAGAIEPRSGGTVEHPANLYPPGTGTCPACGQAGVPTVAGGRLTAHGPEARKDTAGRYWVTTCTGWGEQAR